MKPLAVTFFASLLLALTAQAQRDAVVLTQEQRIAIQHGLAEADHDPGAIDGAFGNSTRAAIWDWQNAGDGVAATGYLSEMDAEILLEAGMKRMLSLGLTFEGGEAQPVNPFRAAAEGTSPPPVPEDERVIHFPQANLCKIKDTDPDYGGSPEYCWVELTDKPGCYAYIPMPTHYWMMSHFTVNDLTWSSTCDGDLVSGDGTFRIEGFYTTESFGVYDYPFLFIEEGSYLDGKRHGPWIERSENVDENVDDSISTEGYIGSYVDGKKHGLWKSEITYYDNDEYLSRSYIDSYVAGERHSRELTEKFNPYYDYKICLGKWVDEFTCITEY